MNWVSILIQKLCSISLVIVITIKTFSRLKRSIQRSSWVWETTPGWRFALSWLAWLHSIHSVPSLVALWRILQQLTSMLELIKGRYWSPIMIVSKCLLVIVYLCSIRLGRYHFSAYCNLKGGLLQRVGRAIAILGTLSLLLELWCFKDGKTLSASHVLRISMMATSHQVDEQTRLVSLLLIIKILN